MDPKLKLIDAKSWWQATEEERASAGMVKASAVAPERVKTHEGETERLLRWVISTAGRDRDLDRVKQQGWQLDNYRKNPVVLWAHEYHGVPIGQTRELAVDGQGDASRLVAVKQFTPKETNPFGFMIYELARDLYLRTASVGFIVKAHEKDPEIEDHERPWWGGGNIISQAELLESSVVPVPSNPEALQEARSVRGIDLSPYVTWAEQILDGEKGAGVWVPKGLVTRAQVEAVQGMATPGPAHVDFARAAAHLPPGITGAKEPSMGSRRTKGELLARRLNEAVDALVTDERTRADVIEDLAAAAGVDAGTVNQILSAEADCPPADRLAAFAGVLDVSSDSLISAAEADGCSYGEDEDGAEGDENSAPAQRSAPCACGGKAPPAEPWRLHFGKTGVYLNGHRVEALESVRIATGKTGRPVVHLELGPEALTVTGAAGDPDPVVASAKSKSTPVADAVAAAKSQIAEAMKEALGKALESTSQRA